MKTRTDDLTLLFVTAGKRPEGWAAFHAEQLAALPYPMITLRDEQKMGEEMIYRRMLEGAKRATTPFVATVEDDCLYHDECFRFRPEMDTFAYNQHRWALFTWGVPTYSWRNRKSNCSLIAPRELLIEALEERFAKWPNGWPIVGEVGRERIETRLGVTPRKSVEWHSKRVGIVQVNHDDSSEARQAVHRKDLGPMQALEIPHWGRAEELIRKFS